MTSAQNINFIHTYFYKINFTFRKNIPTNGNYFCLALVIQHRVIRKITSKEAGNFDIRNKIHPANTTFDAPWLQLIKNLYKAPPKIIKRKQLSIAELRPNEQP